MCDYIMKKKLGNLKNFMKSDDTAQTNTPSYPEEIKVHLTGICKFFYADKFTRGNPSVMSIGNKGNDTVT